MRLRAITPIVVPDDELERRRSRYRRLAPPGVTIHLDNLPAGPDRLESVEQIRESERLVFEEASLTPDDRYDGIFLDCVLDPALDRLQSTARLPVFGITRLVSGYLGSIGLRMGAVARNQAIADELATCIVAGGWSHLFDRVAVLGLSLTDIADTTRWNQAIAGALTGVDSDVIINGCSAVEVRLEDGMRVVDPTALALRLIGAGAGVLEGRKHG